jgi:hypothetical protein
VSDVDDVDVLLQYPIERLDPSIIVEIQEIHEGKRFRLAYIRALESSVSWEQNHAHAVRMAGGDAKKVHGLAAELDRHLLIVNLVGNGCWQSLADDNLNRIAMSNDKGPSILENIAARCDPALRIRAHQENIDA